MLPATAGQVLLRLQPHPHPQPGDDQMATVQHLLNQKGFSVYSIHPDATVFDAIAKMAEHDIGSLLVMDRDKLVGIFPSEIMRAMSYSKVGHPRQRRCEKSWNRGSYVCSLSKPSRNVWLS